MVLIAAHFAFQIAESTDGLIHRRGCGYHDTLTPWEYGVETALTLAKIAAWGGIYLLIARTFVRVSMAFLTFGLLPAIHVFEILF